MSFKEIKNEIKSTYNSTSNNLVDDFYNIVLSQSIQYDRITGYFNSTSLAIVAKGLIKFIDQNGHMRLLCGTELSQEDLESILNAKDLKDLINQKFLSNIENIENKIVKNHVKVLGWMIANNLLEIKIGVLKNNQCYYGGILHSKIGIMYDEFDDVITFNGSVNETASGWINNIESLKVFNSWEDKKFMEADIKIFDRYWNNEEPSLEVIDIPEASKRKLIDIAPKNKSELKKLLLMNTETNKTKQLFTHQKTAIDSWFNNNKMGIFEMATGTGKTFTALKCIEKVLETENVLTIIACPYAHLAEQWKNELIEMNLAKVHSFYGSINNKWKTQFDRLILNYRLNLDFKNIIITTHNTFSNEKFIEKIKKCNIKTFLVVDEMHHVGSSNFQKGLLPNYEYRLGLSATPSRFMDEEGTDFLISYFDKVTFKFTLTEALTRINPATNQTFLTPYEYYPIKVDLSTKELEEYTELSKKIARLYHIKKDTDSEDSLNNLKFKRRNIINNANKKLNTLRETLKKLEHKDHLIVYCSPQQIQKVLGILNEEGFSCHKFTQKENPKQSKKYDGLSERELILKNFDKGNYDALVAMKCLDEGVDVPSADQVIIMSSTTNPIEYVQRRGRVLRRYPNKEKAVIYDLTVIPEEKDMFVSKIIENESKRLYDFVDNSINNHESYTLLEKWGV